MIRFVLSVVILSFCSFPSFAQISDGEGAMQANALKRLAKKAKFGASLISSEFEFKTGKGQMGTPIVIAKEKGQVDLVSIENQTMVGYMLPYNGFVRLENYDFKVSTSKGFRTYKSPPVKISLTDESIFLDDNYGMFYGFDAAEPGTRSRFTYTYNYTDAKYLTRVFFQSGIPVQKYQVTFKVPEWLELDIKEMNFGKDLRIRKDTKKEKGFVIITYTAENIKPLVSESNSLGRPYYLPHLVITVKGYSVDQKTYNGFRTLDDMYAWYNFLYKKAGNNTSVIQTQVNNLTAGKSSDLEKIKSIYYWVQDNIRYIAYEEGYSGFVPQSVQDVFKNKYGDCKGMANIVTEMLKLAGYDAHFAWIGTREIPYDRTKIQSMCVDNHAISVLYHDGKTYFIDGTEKFAPLGTNAYRIQGKSVLVENGDTIS